LNEKDNEQDQVQHFTLDVRPQLSSWRLTRPAAFSVVLIRPCGRSISAVLATAMPLTLLANCRDPSSPANKNGGLLRMTTTGCTLNLSALVSSLMRVSRGPSQARSCRVNCFWRHCGPEKLAGTCAAGEGVCYGRLFGGSEGINSSSSITSLSCSNSYGGGMCFKSGIARAFLQQLDVYHITGTDSTDVCSET
jgi:hypothetical protein